MAEASQPEQPEQNPETERLAKLRSIAQQNLQTIDDEKNQEEADEMKKQAELDRYTKRRKSPKPNNTSPEVQQHSEEKAGSMRTAADVLHRLKWDESLDITKYRIGYLERFEGIKEMNASSWIKESTDEDWIPQHRIKYFKCLDEEGKEKVVWSREERIDRIFWSGIEK